MTSLNILRPATLAAAVICNVSGAAAQAAPETPEEVVAIMNACAIFTAAHDYDAEGQDIEVPWLRIGSFSAGLGDQKSAILVGAQVRGSGTDGNSYCDFVFQEEGVAQIAYDLFMVDRMPITFDEKEGICVDNTFVVVDVTGPDGASASAMNAQGFVTVHNPPKYSGDPCAS